MLLVCREPATTRVGQGLMLDEPLHPVDPNYGTTTFSKQTKKKIKSHEKIENYYLAGASHRLPGSDPRQDT